MTTTHLPEGTTRVTSYHVELIGGSTTRVEGEGAVVMGDGDDGLIQIVTPRVTLFVAPKAHVLFIKRLA